MISRAFIVAAALLLASCGFQPLYGAANGQSAIGPVRVAEIQGSAGHDLRTELVRILSVEEGAGPPSTLRVSLRERIRSLGILVDESASRVEIRLTASYVLTPATGRAIRGAVQTVVTYDIPRSAYGEIAAQADARQRAAESLAPRMRSELAMRLAQSRSP